MKKQCLIARVTEHQLMDIQDQAAIKESRLSDIQQPIFLAQAGKMK